VTAAERERSWELVEQLVTQGLPAAREETLALVRTIKENPEQNRRIYGVLAVNGMVLAGLGSEQIANELGIWARAAARGPEPVPGCPQRPLKQDDAYTVGGLEASSSLHRGAASDAPSERVPASSGHKTGFGVEAIAQ
jgi:hypothetical protein